MDSAVLCKLTSLKGMAPVPGATAEDASAGASEPSSLPFKL